MGVIQESRMPFIGNLTKFTLAYPTVESAFVRFTETDAGCSPCHRVHDFADGPRIACGNPHCQRGGYDFEWALSEMVRRGLEHNNIDFSCAGDEGTPKGRLKGQSCLMSMTGAITIKYKKPAALMDKT